MLKSIILILAVAGAALLEFAAIVAMGFGIYVLCRIIENIYRNRRGKV